MEEPVNVQYWVNETEYQVLAENELTDRDLDAVAGGGRALTKSGMALHARPGLRLGGHGAGSIPTRRS